MVWVTLNVFCEFAVLRSLLGVIPMFVESALQLFSSLADVNHFTSLTGSCINEVFAGAVTTNNWHRSTGFDVRDFSLAADEIARFAFTAR